MFVVRESPAQKLPLGLLAGQMILEPLLEDVSSIFRIDREGLTK